MNTIDWGRCDKVTRMSELGGPGRSVDDMLSEAGITDVTVNKFVLNGLGSVVPRVGTLITTPDGRQVMYPMPEGGAKGFMDLP